jgi:PAS domain S-box-containing protein
MRDADKTKEQLIAELVQLRRRAAGQDPAAAPSADSPGRGEPGDGARPAGAGRRREADEERSRLQAILAAALECLPFGLWAIGPDGRYILENAANRAVWGEVVGKRPADVAVSEKVLSLWLDNNRRAMAGERVEGEVEAHVGDRTYHFYNVIAPIRDGDAICGILGVNVDVTDRKQAEEALKKARDELEQRVEQRTAELARANEDLAIFREFADASGQGFSMADLDGYITYVNPALCRMLGEQRPEDVLGKHLSAHFSEESNRRGKEEIQPALKHSGHWEGELPMLSCSGASIPTWHNTFLIRDQGGTPLRIAVVITDIAARKQAEEALRQSYDQLRAIYDGILDGITIVDGQTWNPVQANLAFCRMLGYSPEEVKRLTPDRIHRPETLPTVREHCQAAARGIVARIDELPFVHKDGRTIYADVVSSPICYRGRPGWISFFHDVTQPRRARIALERERRTLEHLLNASDHERQLIAYDIHDGLAQALAGAIMQFQVYDQFKDSRPDDARKAYDGGITLLHQGHAEARRLISGVRPPILDDSGVVAAIAHLVHDPAFNQGPMVDFRSRVTFSRLAPVVENAIYRIVQEGLNNARNHSRSTRIVVSLVQRDDRLRIKIRDWGIGFEPERMAKNRFGLPGIRERARLLGGRYRVKSQPGRGTLLFVEVPVVGRED